LKQVQDDISNKLFVDLGFFYYDSGAVYSKSFTLIPSPHPSPLGGEGDVEEEGRNYEQG
jgi:hypothetical protein